MDVIQKRPSLMNLSMSLGFTMTNPELIDKYVTIN